MDDPKQARKEPSAESLILDFLEKLANPASSLQSFRNTYASVVRVIIQSRLDDFSKRFRAQAAYLTGLAGVAAIFALIQVGFVAIVDNPDCDDVPLPNGCQSHLRLLRNVVTFLTYIGLSCHALGAFSSLLIARTLLEVVNVAQDVQDEKYVLDTLILERMDSYNLAAKRINADPQLFEVCKEKAEALFERIERHQHVVDKHTGGQSRVLSFIMLGILLFFAALVFQVVLSQPRELWILFILGVATMVATLGQSEHHTHPGSWMALMRRAHRVVDAESTPHRGDLVSEPSSLNTTGDIFAQIIGIDDYFSNDIRSLNGAVNDARAFEQYLQDVLQVPAANIVSLKNEAATRNNILSTFSSHFLNNDNIPDHGNATMILYFAGHGSRADGPGNAINLDGKVEVLCPVDERTTDSQGNYVHAIPDYALGWLLFELSEKKGKNITVIVDCCHSGRIADKAREVLPGMARTPDSASMPVALDIDQHLWTGYEDIVKKHRSWRQSQSSHVLLAACAEDEMAQETFNDEENTVRGCFSAALLNQLRQISLGSTTYTQLLDTFPSLSDQTPHCDGERGHELIFHLDSAALRLLAEKSEEHPPQFSSETTPTPPWTLENCNIGNLHITNVTNSIIVDPSRSGLGDADLEQRRRAIRQRAPSFP